MHLLIAGGAGFVGSNLAIYLRAEHPDWAITCIDNLSRKGSALNLPRLAAAGVVFKQADTRFPEQLKTDEVVDVVIDAAAEPSVLAGLDGGLDYLIHTNLNGTVHLLQLAREKKAGFLLLSTSRVYPVAALESIALLEGGMRFEAEAIQSLHGVGPNGISEDFTLRGARSLYGATKLASELLAEEFAAAFGLHTIINRCGVIAGPWQMGKVDQGVAALWVAAHYFGRPLSYIGYGGRGLQVRDMLHIDDLCRLIDYQLMHPEGLGGALCNAGGGKASSASLCELTTICENITGSKIDITSSDTSRPGDIPWYITDNSKITAATGWQPQKNVEDIVRDIYGWIQENEALLRPVFAGG